MSSNPSMQCSVCGKWMRLTGKDEQGCEIRRFYPCCGENGEFEHEKPVCNDCCKTKCPYRMKNDLAQKIYLALNGEGLPVYDIHRPIIQKVLNESPSTDVSGLREALEKIKKEYKECWKHEPRLPDEEIESCERCGGMTQIEQGGDIVDCYVCAGTGEKKAEKYFDAEQFVDFIESQIEVVAQYSTLTAPADKIEGSISEGEEDQETLWEEFFNEIVWDERESNSDVRQIEKSLQRKYQITRKQ